MGYIIILLVAGDFTDEDLSQLEMVEWRRRRLNGKGGKGDKTRDGGCLKGSLL